jgi:two-component system, chemotaxis family, sensor histidine kinase and response regulator PixL
MHRPATSPRARLGPILLVDDYDDGRGWVRDALEDAGYRVEEAGDGQQALNVLVSRADEPVALIILDLEMPVMDGWRFIQVVESYVRLSTIPVIVATAQPPKLMPVAHQAVFGCLRKPYEVTTLVQMVQACLDAHAAPKSASARS